jgi:hypothetical protein
MADDQRITPLVLDGYDEFGSTDALAALVALGGDAEAFCRDVVAALGAAAARLRHERRAQLVFPGAREHAESLTARLLEIVKARDEAVRLEVPAAASAYRDIARRLELALERAEQEVERHDPQRLKAARIAAATTAVDRRAQHQIPPIAPITPGVPDPDEVAARRRKIRAQIRAGTVPPPGHVTPTTFIDPHLRAIDREFMPRVAVVVHRLVRQHVGAAIERDAAVEFPRDRPIPDAAERARFESDRRNWISGRANRLTCDLVRAFFPIWSANVTVARVRESVRRDRRRGPESWPAEPTDD